MVTLTETSALATHVRRTVDEAMQGCMGKGMRFRDERARWRGGRCRQATTRARASASADLCAARGIGGVRHGGVATEQAR